MGDLISIAKTEQISPGSGFVAEVQDKSFAVFNLEGSYRVIDNTCLHRGGPLGDGDLAGEIVTCPWHGWEYNVKTGACTNNPAACVKTYEVIVDGSDIKIEV
ncbi:MAG: assimilatory nitrite reductase [NAD(P)H] small subunit [Nitrospirales bacterium]|nr:MAG: assimilatory nitrite reductase [NAD(P)H] small subunit [Nitrospirales bacterium]